MNIAIMRFSALGDIAATLPTVRSLQYKPVIITSPIGYELLKDEFDDFIIMHDKSALSVMKLIWEIKKHNFSHIFDFQCNDRTKLITTFLNSTIYHSRNLFIPDEKNIFLAIAEQSSMLRPLDFTFHKKKHTYIVLNCGASIKWLSKRLPNQKWKEISEILYQKFKLPFYLTGDESEKEYIEELATHLVGEKYVLAGKTNLIELKYTLTNAFLTVSTDSAAMHISSVQRTPTIGIFGATNWKRSYPFGPWSTTIYDKVLYPDGIPPKWNTQTIGNYYDNINIVDGLKKIANYLE